MARFPPRPRSLGFRLLNNQDPGSLARIGLHFHFVRLEDITEHRSASLHLKSRLEKAAHDLLVGELAEYFCERHSLLMRQMVGVEFSIEPGCVRVHKRPQYLAPRCRSLRQPRITGCSTRAVLGTRFGSRAGSSEGASSWRRYANQQNVKRRGYLTEITVWRSQARLS